MTYHWVGNKSTITDATCGQCPLMTGATCGQCPLMTGATCGQCPLSFGHCVGCRSSIWYLQTFINPILSGKSDEMKLRQNVRLCHSERLAFPANIHLIHTL
jgi:hypothetical protein